MNNGIFLLLGTNLGDKAKNLSIGREHLEQKAGTILSASSVYKTAPWGVLNQPEFYNQVIMLQTVLTPHELLNVILAIELDMGRIREEKWGARIIDIDILLYDSLVIRESSLVIPHPGIPDRRFTLQPLCEIAGERIHPGLQKTMNSLLQECTDASRVEKVL